MYFLHSKSAVFYDLKSFFAYVETQFSTGIKVLRSDSGGEYISHEFHDFLQQKGVVSQRSCPYTQQQNWVAERKNRHLLDFNRTLLLEFFVQPKFWVETLSNALYLINRLPFQVLNFDSPYYRLYHKSPAIVTCIVLVVFALFICLHMNDKLPAQSVKCVFLGYTTSHKGFVCYDLSCSKFRISRNAVFF